MFMRCDCKFRYATLQYCIVWPTATDGLFEIFALFSLNFIEDSKIPCWYPKFDYFDQFTVIAATPMVLLVGCFAYGTLSGYCAEKRIGKSMKQAKRKRRVAIHHVDTSVADSVRAAVKRGLSTWLPLFFFVPVMILYSTFSP